MIFISKIKNVKVYTIDGVRTHADLRLVDLKSTPLDHSGTMVLQITITIPHPIRRVNSKHI